MLSNGCSEGGHHDGAGDAVVGCDRGGITGAVVEPGQDLGVGVVTLVGATESVVGEVALRGLVGHRSLEADVGGLGPFLRLGRHQPVGLEVSRDRRSGDGHAVVVKVPGDGVRAGVQASGGQLLPVLDDEFDDVGGFGRVVRGTVLGRRERGSKAASPSAL